MKLNIHFYLLISIFLTQLIFCKNIFGQENKTKSENNPTFDHALLWEISGNNATQSMYIMGTHHLYDRRFLNTDKSIQNILPKIDVFVGELHEDSLENASKSMMFMKYMLLENTTMKELLSEKQYKKVDKMLKAETGLALSMLNTMKPMVTTQYIQIAKYMKNIKKNDNFNILSSGLDHSIDGYFQEFAKKNNKLVLGLETAEYQMEALYNGTNLKKQVENLMDLVENKNAGSNETMQKMDDLYVEQDIAGLYQYLEKYSTKEEMETLLYKRNKNWFPMLISMLQSPKKHFVAVGSGHLAGKIGILTMLKDAGYTLKPIKLEMR